MIKKLVRLLTVGAAVVGFGVTAVDADTPEGMPDCPGTVVWVNYPADGSSLTCDANPPQVVHIRYVLSTLTLATAHSWCIDQGGDAVHTRYAATANVCTNVDY